MPLFQTDNCYYFLDANSLKPDINLDLFNEFLTLVKIPLEIKISSIQGAGNGVFATSFIKRGREIGIYGGELLTQQEFEERYPQEKEDEWRKNLPPLVVYQQDEWLHTKLEKYHDRVRQELNNYFRKKVNQEYPKLSNLQEGPPIFKDIPEIEYDNGRTTRYIFELNPAFELEGGKLIKYIDGEYPYVTNWGGFINQYPIYPHFITPNVYFNDQTGFIEAIKDIKKGEELFIDYGTNYWMERTYLPT